jgi:hypothetical protein
MGALGYRDGIELLRNYTTGASISPILEFIYSVHLENDASLSPLDEIGVRDKYPDQLRALLEFLGSIIHRRKGITVLYEKAIQRYQTISELTTKRRATDEENKIKQTLTDYILKIEKLYEINDLSDESVVKELYRFVNESGLENMTENELEKYIVSSKTMTLLEPHLDRLREIYLGYDKLIDPTTRLVNIADYILEDANRMVS